MVNHTEEAIHMERMSPMAVEGEGARRRRICCTRAAKRWHNALEADAALRPLKVELSRRRVIKLNEHQRRITFNTGCTGGGVGSRGNIVYVVISIGGG